jgi:hypothetical protein
MGGGAKDPQFTRLSEIEGSETEGLRLKISGGSWKGEHNDQKAKDAAAVIDFQCDPDRSGLEGISTKEAQPEDEKSEKRRRAEGEGEGEGKDEGEGDGENSSDQSLQYKSFSPNEDGVYVLKLEWRTRYACDDYQRGKEASSNGHWGFFTWMIIM